MDEKTQRHELETIHSEYSPFFTTCDVKQGTSGSSKSYYPTSLTKPQLYLQILTKDGKDLQIAVGLSGWYQLKDADDLKHHYETFETLMMRISPGFQSSFNNSLASKLLLLQEEDR